ncbi:hypothetical protein BCR34DRAFT_604552 [Clohesyomyces aquaticus]|uniref:MARVEL domain-containing protein n=1 Tax=Clohesyomyces aquaticus TaxID=1231657 RepID=A0A1Y1Z568_9PLEO|nr:hypothetical protein BCR34DRAFT_604552 [Clohesyomyces aquaticus]
MSGELPPHVLPLPRWTLVLHGAQIGLAIIILGLDAYGIRWIDYNALIYSLVCALCTLVVAIYMGVSTLFAHKAYNFWAFLALNIWMVIFWIVDLGLVANLAALWSAPSCGYTYGYYYDYYTCTYGKRDMSSLAKRDSTTYSAYRGALVAGALFGALQFVLWTASLIMLALYIHRHRTNEASTASPPTYTAGAPSNGQAAPVGMEKYSGTAQPTQQGYPQQVQQPQYAQPVQQQQPQQQFVQQQPQQYVQQPAQPMYNQAQYTSPYPQQQDPINRAATVSPATTAGGYASPAPHTVELASPQQTGQPYNPNVPELR